MKVILDVSPANMGKALNAVFVVQRETPQQKIGTSNGVKRGPFVVVRNKDSYTVKDST